MLTYLRRAWRAIRGEWAAMLELFLVAALWVAAFALIFIAQGLAVIARILREILEQLRRR